MSMPECKVDDRPIVDGDTVQFRVDGDLAYMPGVKGSEGKLRILTSELKVTPPLPPPAASEGKGSNPADERGQVIGTGMHMLGQKQQAWSTDPSSVKRPSYNGASSGPAMATGPVMAVPVTGGPPVMVMPTGPVGGGVVTGVPVTGGPPIVGMPTGPVGGAHTGGGGPPPWVHLLRVRAGNQIYQLECDARPCENDKTRFGLGDTILIRTEKKSAYVSSDTGTAAKEQKFRILDKTELDTPPVIK